MPLERLISVFGGTGFLGSRVVAHLLAAGHRVRIAARSPDRRPELLEGDRVEACAADLFDSKSLTDALQGADGAVNATSLYVEQADLTYEAVHVDGAERLAELAWKAGLSRFVQLSGVGSAPQAANGYIRARGRGEVAVRAAFPGAAVVRPAVMFGEGDALLSAIRSTLRRLPFYPLFGVGTTRLQPAWVEDVAGAITRLLEADANAPCYELAGGDIITYRELVECVAEADGLRARTFPVPFAVWKSLAAVAERLPSAPLTRAQVALMQIDNVASETLPGISALGIMPNGVIDHIRGQGSAGGRAVV